MTATPEIHPPLPVAYADLAERHLADLWHVARWLADDVPAAEDLVQDTLCTGLRRYGDVDEETDARCWLFTLMCEASSARSNGGGALAAGAVFVDDLGRALRSLPIRLRIPILLLDVAGLSYGEIARVLGLPVGAVRSRIADARLRLAPPAASPMPGLAAGRIDGPGAEAGGALGGPRVRPMARGTAGHVDEAPWGAGTRSSW